MKPLMIFGIAALVLGGLLLGVGFLFAVFNWPDLFAGLMSGPVLIGIGILLIIGARWQKS